MRAPDEAGAPRSREGRAQDERPAPGEVPPTTGHVAPLPPGRELARVRVLGTVWSVLDHDSGLEEDVAAAWSRCVVDDPADEVIHLVPDATEPPAGEVVTVHGDQGGYALASRLVATSIAHNVGNALMVHAGALTAPGTDRALALVAASGTGKTTASRVLGQAGWGYLTDECVSVHEDWRVDPLPKPLSLVTDPERSAHVKHQLGPDEAGMGGAPQHARLVGIVLLHRLRTAAEREEDEGPTPRLEQVGLSEALGLLAPQTSALSRTPGGLLALSRAVEELGVHRLVYSEISECLDLLAERAAAGPAPDPEEQAEHLEGSAPWNATPPTGRQDGDLHGDERWGRCDFSQAVLVDGVEGVVMTGSRVVRLSPVGTVVWTLLEAAPMTVAQLSERLQEHFGEHPEAAQHTAEAVQALWHEGLVEVVTG